MNKELKEAIKRLKLHKEYSALQNGTCIVNISDLELVLQASEKLVEEITNE